MFHYSGSYLLIKCNYRATAPEMLGPAEVYKLASCLDKLRGSRWINGKRHTLFPLYFT